MGVFDTVRQWFEPIPEPGRTQDDRQLVAQFAKAERIEARTLDPSAQYPDWDTQVLQAFGMYGGPYRIPSVREACGVPSIFRATSLIYNTVGSLAMETFRNGLPLDSGPEHTFASRPDPFRNGFYFYRDTAAFGANRGEAWWWVAKRDADGRAISLIVVPPWEVTIDQGTNRLNPKVMWLDQEMDPRDMKHLVFFPDPDGGPRGVGPLQLCGAAVSVAVESQAWAANFYAEGGYPSIHIKAAGALGDSVDGDALSEAEEIKRQFRLRDHNTPLVTDEGIESVDEFGVNPQGAQMLEARFQNRGDVANMFGIPGKLLEYSAPGSSLTYQSVPEVFREWVRSGLQNNYLDLIEHEMSDLLPRSTTARFNVDSFERADPKARWQTYKLMAEVVGAEEAARIARQSEGIEPGDVEFMPVPFAPPAAFPTRLPIARSAEAVRCSGKRIIGGIRKPCNKLLAEAGPFTGTCSRCGTTYTAA